MQILLNYKIDHLGLISDESCAVCEQGILQCFQFYVQPCIETLCFVLMNQYDFICSTSTGFVQPTYSLEAMKVLLDGLLQLNMIRSESTLVHHSIPARVQSS